MSKKMNARQSFGYRVCTHLILFSFFCSTIIPSVAMDNGLQEQRKTKPVSMAALAWIQELERVRETADKETFESLTNEISATIAGKYGISDRQATPEEQELIISSITRTRHRFMDEDNILSNRYLSYNPLETRAALQTNSRFKDHMAAVLAIDSIVAKALNYGEFEEMWRQDNESKTISPAFVSSVIRHVKDYEERETAELFHQPLQRFLETNQDTIHLANDVFNTLIQKIRLAQNVQAEPSIMCGVMSSDIGTIIFKMLSFKDSIAYATSTAETYRSLSIWHNIRNVHSLKLNTQHIQDSVEGFRAAIYASYYIQRNFVDLHENRRNLVSDYFLIRTIRIGYEPLFVKSLLGYLLMAAGRNDDAFEELSQADVPLTRKLRAKLEKDIIIFNSSWPYCVWPGYAYIHERAGLGDNVSQRFVRDIYSYDDFAFLSAFEFESYLECYAPDDPHAFEKLKEERKLRERILL